jgi:hypothetical protein
LDSPRTLERKAPANDDEAKQNCLNFISQFVEPADKETIRSLNLTKDIKERSGLSFGITPPDAEDAYLARFVDFCLLKE